MTSAPPNTIRVACRHCGMVMTARREHAGRPAKCPRCERVIRLQEAPAPEHPSGLPAPKAAPKNEKPTTTSLSCRVCDTRMSFDLKHVGRKTKCPDCGVVNVIPPPPAPKKPKPPAAMRGEQYDVWHTDDQPWGIDLARNAPQRVRVTCQVCQTMIDAAPEQIGKRVECPDCGHQNKVERPAPPPPGAKPNPRAMPAYEVDTTPAPEPALPTDAWLVTDDRQRENGYARSTRPKLPRWPMVQGVLAFIRSPGFVGRWLGLSAGLGGAAALLVFAATQLIAAANIGSLGAVGYVMMGATAGLIGAIVGLLTAINAAAYAMTILTESSDGNDQIHQWPTPGVTDGMGELLVFVVAGMVAAFPGWAIGSFVASGFPANAAWGPVPQFIGLAISLVLFFPLVLLSQLAASSPWSVVTLEVVLAVPRTLGSWALLFCENVLLVLLAEVALATALAVPLLAIVAAPVLVLLGAIAFRLIGRLAWVVAERS